MVERANRSLSTQLASRAVELFEVPAAAPSFSDRDAGSRDDSFFASAMGALGYSGFSHVRAAAGIDPAELLMGALDRDNLDSRVTEALPWLPLAYPEMDWDWLARKAKLRGRQNRLAFVVALASQVAVKKGKGALAAELLERAVSSRG